MLPPGHLPMGDGAVLVELENLEQVLVLDRALRGARPGWVQDVIPAARTLLISFDPTVTTAQQVSLWLEARHAHSDPAAAQPALPARTEQIPVRYDGADLAVVSAMTGLTIDEVIAQHSAAEYTAAFCGFAPGFAYLTGGPAALRVPRRASPRTRVPAGAVALAGEFCAVYPRASPGGWQLIGSTDLMMFDVDRTPAVLLSPGTIVRFVPVR